MDELSTILHENDPLATLLPTTDSDGDRQPTRVEDEAAGKEPDRLPLIAGYVWKEKLGQGGMGALAA